MKELETNTFDALIESASQALSQSQAILQEIADDPDALCLPEDSIESKAQMLQLVLQLRLDSQSALARIMRVEQSLQALGIGPQYSAQVNMERMAFALGGDDLKHMLFALSQLVQSLIKIAHRQQKNKQTVSRQKQIAYASSAGFKKLYKGLQKAVDHQKLFLAALETLNLRLEDLIKKEALGPVFDHIAALRGPISQFYQAIQNGLEKSQRLYEKTNQEVQLTNSVTNVLQQAEEALRQMPMPYAQPPLFTPDRRLSAERLEERAATKRLGHFFGP